MLQYILQLAFIIHAKISGKSIKGHPVVESLVECRIVLERMKPIEVKLKYQIDKLVRTAVLGTQQLDKDQTGKQSKGTGYAYVYYMCILII
jgi:U3 small nucleolar ribonucleoprotein protein LCP5